MQLQLQIRSLVPRDPTDDDTVGVQLVAAVQRALAKGAAPTAAVSVREERVDIFMGGQIQAGQVPINLFVAGLTRAEAPGGDLHCVGLVGTLTHKKNGVKQAVVFLEWADCRWWLWRGLIDADGRLLENTESVLRAVDGDTKPIPMGGWWSLGRRAKLQARLDAPKSSFVH